MRHYLYILFIGFILLLTSCRQDFEFEPSSGGLEFSKQTVYLDTVFTNIGSSTYTLKVYNNSDKDIKIPTLQLAQGQNSKYRLMVDGMPGKVFNNVELLAKDSMFIFIETTIDYSEYANPDSEYLYTDKIEFHNISGAPQTVDLVTLVRDAIFIKPDRPLPTNIKEKLTINGELTDIEGHELATTDELNWTNTKPYVVYGYALVPNGKTLNIGEGTKVYFHADSGLIVDDTGTLIIDGNVSTFDTDGNVLVDNEVVFESDRLEYDFSEVAGQWGTVLLFSGMNNTIDHLTIKNATIGLFIQRINVSTTPKVTITNSQIYNCTNYGILARTALVNGQNVVVNNCGQAGLACSYGGDYNFTHCTFANYWPRPNQVPVVLDNYDGTAPYALTNANFNNCIIYGSSSYGISLKKEGNLFNYNFRNCLIKFFDFGQFETDPLYPIANTTNYPNCIIARNSTTNKPDFLNPNNNKLIIGENSAAKGTADFSFSNGTFDILNKERLGPLSDMGAYNFVIFE